MLKIGFGHIVLFHLRSIAAPPPAPPTNDALTSIVRKNASYLISHKIKKYLLFKYSRYSKTMFDNIVAKLFSIFIIVTDNESDLF